MNIRSTIILWVVAIIGVVAAVLIDRGGPVGSAAARAARVPLLDARQVPVDDVDRIVLQRRDGPEIEMVRDADGGWRQVRPFECALDAFSIRQLPRLATEVEVVEVLDAVVAGIARSTLGLDPPAARMRLGWSGGEVELRLGRRGVGGLAYIEREEGGPIFVVTQALHERAVDMDPREWRDRAIFRNVGVDSDRIEIRDGATVTVLARDRKRWRMIEPVPSRLGPIARDELFQAIGRARSSGFIVDEPTDLSRFGLTEPVGSITVITTRRSPVGQDETSEETQRLIIGARIGVASQDRFGLIEGQAMIVRIGESVIQALFRSPSQLVSRVASGVSAADVKSIVIQGPAGEVRLERDLDRWRSPDTGGELVESGPVEALLRMLTEEEAPEIALGVFPRDLQLATITLHGFDSRPRDTVRIAREQQDGSRWALENGDSVLRVFPAEKAMPLTPDAFGVKATDGDG